MFNSPISKKSFVLAFFFALCVVLVVFISSFFNRRTTIVFCDVGQGDAAYMRIKNKVDILIDAGPDKKVLSCLGKYMPFYDRTIEYAFLSHPQKDHYGGFSYVLDRYSIGDFFLPPITNPSESIQKLYTSVTKHGVKQQPFAKGKTIAVENMLIRSLWPPAGDSISAADSNNSSQMLFVSFPKTNILFTGDYDFAHDTANAIRTLSQTTILKIPHHGSKNGLTKSVIGKTKPKIVVISVGKKNSYGHPASSVLKMLSTADIIIRRTDKEGDVVFTLRQ